MASTERFKLIASVYLILEKNGKVLLSRRFQTGYEDGKYGLVAGHVDGKEKLTAAMVREAYEEAGMKLDPKKLELVLTMHRWCGDHERVDLFFTSKVWGGTIENKEPDKCDDLDWFPIQKLPKNTIKYIKTAIDCCQNKIRYYEFGWKK